ncbi:methyl-accepting chemotaxis protein [Sphingomonas sp. GlSt437]|uniref:methyl-accepting chemotaxis protein n=1 Tax=Sphingomonas sp. GlSt437 TaxID=3389970 RepID=UPI003A86C4E5
MIDELYQLRQRAYRLLIIVAWACAAWMGILGLLLKSPDTIPAVLLAAIANIVPTIMWRARRVDATARLAIGTLAAVHPALAVWLWSGHPFQMDTHMYFFVALSALAVLCDWRPIALAAVLIALHHIAFAIVAPSVEFPDGGGVLRVVIHAVAVVMEFSVLAYLTTRLRALLTAQYDARRRSEALAAEADDRRRDVERAMEEAREAEAHAARERAARERAESEAKIRHRQELQRLAQSFQGTISGVVLSVASAASQLEDLARTLNTLALEASRQTAQTAHAAGRTAGNVAELADQMQSIGVSISAILAAVEQQAQLSGTASCVSRDGHEAVRTLADRTTSISDFADRVQEIAGSTNLLALNATIEAARSGEAGRGFAVVAGEVKQLARQAADATNEIRTLAGTVSHGAVEVNATLSGIARIVDEVAQAAQSIKDEVSSQRRSVDVIDRAARETAHDVGAMASDVERIAQVAARAETLSDGVLSAASTLLGAATSLRKATDQFVEDLAA